MENKIFTIYNLARSPIKSPVVISELRALTYESLSSDVFVWGMSTGSELYALFCCDFEQFFGKWSKSKGT